jgi:hypothetical protein
VFLPAKIYVVAGPGVVEAQVEVAITIIMITVAMHQTMQASHSTVNRCHHTATVAVVVFMITHPHILRTPLAHHHNNMAGDMAQVDLEHTHHIPRTATTLIRMVVGDTNRGRPRVRTAGVDITLDPQAEGDTMDIGVGDMVVVAVVAMVDTAMDMAEEGSAAPRHIRAATVLAPMMVATPQAAVLRHEGVVEVEVIKFRPSLRDLHNQHFYASLS